MTLTTGNNVFIDSVIV